MLRQDLLSASPSLLYQTVLVFGAALERFEQSLLLLESHTSVSTLLLAPSSFTAGRATTIATALFL